jgi:hypothetical protein
MAIHALQCHKVSVMEVPNSKAGRDSMEYKIYGMDGIPKEFILQRIHNKRLKLSKEQEGEEVGDEEEEEGDEEVVQPPNLQPSYL